MSPPLTPLARTWAFPALLMLACAGASGGCSPKVSSTPLSVDRTADGYYYGAPASGGKVLNQTAPDPQSVRNKPKKKIAATEKAPIPRESKSDHSSPEEDTGKAEDAPKVSPDEFAAKFAGDYSGKDIVVIELSGFPPQPQEDENAKLRITVSGDEVSATVVDSNSGTDLCTIVGRPEGAVIRFTPGQACFSDMLGIPMSTELISGEATLKDERVKIGFDVALELSAGGESLSGKLNYSFEGERD